MHNIIGSRKLKILLGVLFISFVLRTILSFITSNETITLIANASIATFSIVVVIAFIYIAIKD